MTGQKFDRIVATAALLVALVAAIPAVYNFEKQRFIWVRDVQQRQIHQQQNIQYNPNAKL